MARVYRKYAEDNLENAKPEYLKFACNLRSLMDAKDIGIQELADALGLSSRTSISMYRTGKQFPPNPEQLIKLANALDTTVDALVGNERQYYTPDEDLLYYADNLGLEPETVESIKRITSPVAGTRNALNALLSIDGIKELAAAIHAVQVKSRKCRQEIEQHPELPNRYREERMNTITGEVYTACKAFDRLIWNVVHSETGGNDGENDSE